MHLPEFLLHSMLRTCWIFPHALPQTHNTLGDDLLAVHFALKALRETCKNPLVLLLGAQSLKFYVGNTRTLTVIPCSPDKYLWQENECYIEADNIENIRRITLPAAFINDLSWDSVLARAVVTSYHASYYQWSFTLPF